MKNYLLFCLAVFALSSCDVFRFYDFKINDTKEFQVKTDCGTLQITSAVTDFITYREVRIEFVADSMKKKYAIIPEKFRLYANSKQIPLKKAYIDHRKTHFAIDGQFKDSIGNGLKIFILADGAIMCNGEPLITKDTLHFEILPRE